MASLKADGYRPRTGFLGTTILLDTMVDQLNATDIAYSILLQRGCPGWLYSVDQGATTIWERWNGYTKEKGFGPVAMNSFNHYAYGAVMGWMYRTMAGIRPGKDGGYRKFVLAPHPDKRIGFCSAEYRTRNGIVKSSWKYDSDGGCSYSFTVPEGTSATLRMPGMPEKCLVPGTHEMTIK
jgi:alpha-L-rhamnosidase